MTCFIFLFPSSRSVLRRALGHAIISVWTPSALGFRFSLRLSRLTPR